MRFNHLIPALVIGLLFITGCDQDSNTSAIPEEPNEQLAWAMSNALDDDQIREDVHTAMDHSPYVEHKLVLGEFLDSDQGSRLKAGLETQLGSADKLDQLLGELPEMDFYLPYETHRETWEHADEQLMVVCVLHPDATEATAYTSDNETKLLDTTEKIYDARHWALFSLHPAEVKIHKTQSTKSIPLTTSDSGIYMVKVVNYVTDGLFGGACEFYFRTSVDFINYESSEIFHVLPAFEEHGFALNHTDPSIKVFENGFQITKHPLPLTPQTEYETMRIELIEVDEYTSQFENEYFPFDSIVLSEDQYNISEDGEIGFGGTPGDHVVTVTIQER